MKRDYSTNLLLLLGFAAVVLAAGIGLRDPWPADEPRFALIARDMVESGNWLLPRVGGVLYPDKPPLFFWAVAAFYAITGSIRVALLLPGFVAGLGVLWLVTDLARRLWGPRTAIWCGATLLATVQFPLQMKGGQIDGFLCLMTTLGLYGLLRHLLLGPDWRWYTVGGVAAGLGVVTKGVGFLPLFAFLPWLVAVQRGWPGFRHTWRDWRWLLAPAGFLLAVSAWLLPMLLATASGGDFAAYRDNILFHQTITRYADSWGHIKPPWYLLTNAVPWLWLPGTLLLPWLVPLWRQDLRNRHAAVLVLSLWIVLVLLFFSASTGKRSVYIFPAAPAFAMLVGLHAERVLRRAGAQRVLVALPILLGSLVVAVALYALGNPHKLAEWVTDSVVVFRICMALLAIGVAMLAIVAVCRRRWLRTGFAGSMAVLWLGISVLVAPPIDATRSGAGLMQSVASKVAMDQQLGFVAWPEQFLLHWHRDAYHFGFRRDPADEVLDAVSWLRQAGDRRVLMPLELAEPCFVAGRATSAGRAHRRDWAIFDRTALSDECTGVPPEPVKLVHYSPPHRAKPENADMEAIKPGSAVTD